jgi:hypothetical protein
MASLYVSFYGGVDYGVASRPSGSEVVTTSGTSAKTSGNDGGVVASVFSDAAHYVNVGPSASVTAAAGTSAYVPANTLVWLKLTQGDEIAAITV